MLFIEKIVLKMTGSNFSSILQLTDLDDFIVPSQDCIKPLKVHPTIVDIGSKTKIDYSTDNFKSPDILKSRGTRVDISLGDCLACSGCITSAETVLISQQNHEELLRTLKTNELLRNNNEKSKYIVLSLSVQPIVSLAERYHLCVQDAALRISGFFKEKGVNMVLLMTAAEDMAIQECSREFILRYREQKRNTKCSSPLFTSACPGWICYVEKTHDFMVPLISSTKSPQQIMGSIVKDYLANVKELTAKDIYHVTLMPCYDKKLEASRSDFYNADLQAKDVDCVITPVELELMLQNENKMLLDVKAEPLDTLHEELDEAWDFVCVRDGSTSGGYARHVLINAAKELNFPFKNIEFNNVKNADLQECCLEKNGEKLTFAIVNGFRNIQNVIQKMRRKRFRYDFVEIMACPSGCINGSAQIRPPDGMTSKELVAKLERTFDDVRKCISTKTKLTNHLYMSWLGGADSEKAKAMLHTSYHAIPKESSVLNVKW